MSPKPPIAFAVSLRFEPFYALNLLLNPRARIHSTWCEQTLASLPASFHDRVRETGTASEIWATLPSVLPRTLITPSIDEIVATLRALPVEQFQEQLLTGVLHAPAVVTSLLGKRLDLRKALSKIAPVKREWLGYMGLYPYDARSPIIIAIDALLADPEAFRRALVELLDTFWSTAFAATWDRLAPQLHASCEEKERLFATCSLSEFFEGALIRAGVDEKRGIIKAVRGGFELPLSRVQAVHFFPSAFNDRRYWSALGEDSPPLTAFFPYFDPAVTLTASATTGASREIARPELDPALIFKALGDSTRFAIAGLLAESPRTSVEIARALSVSKPTVSHHISLMRQAGILREEHVSGAVRLALDRDVLENLSTLLLRKLYRAR